MRPLLGIALEASRQTQGRRSTAWLASTGCRRPAARAAARRRDRGRRRPDPRGRRRRSRRSAGSAPCSCCPTSSVTPWPYRRRCVIDDINHADDATRELLEVLATRRPSVPLLVVTTSVPEETLTASASRSASSTSRRVAMIEALLGNRAIAPGTVPLDRPACRRQPAVRRRAAAVHWRRIPTPTIPSSLEALVEARIDTLDAADRQLLRNASVLGSEVDITLLGRMSDDALIRRQDRWDRLDRFLERVGARRRALPLRHLPPRRLRRPLLPDPAHAAPSGDRRPRADRAHRAASSSWPCLTFHAHHSGDRERTWRYGTAAAAAAAGAAMFGESARLYTLALRAPSADVAADELSVVAERAGDVYEVVGQLEEAERALALATRRLAAGRSTRPGCGASVPRSPSGWAATARRSAASAGRRGRCARFRGRRRCASGRAGSRRRACSPLRQSRLEEAWNYATSALSKAQLVEDWKTAAHAATDGRQPRDQPALGGRRRCSVPTSSSCAARPVIPSGEAKYLSNRAIDLYFDGDWRSAVRMYRESAERSAEYGHAVSEATCLNNIAEILSDQGRYDEATRCCAGPAGRGARSATASASRYADSNLGRLATRTLRSMRPTSCCLVDDRFALGSTPTSTEVALRTIETQLRAVALAVGATCGWPPTTSSRSSRRCRSTPIGCDVARRDDLEAAPPHRPQHSQGPSGRRAVRAGAVAACSAAMLTGDGSGRRGRGDLRRLEVVTPPPLPAAGADGTTASADAFRPGARACRAAHGRGSPAGIVVRVDKSSNNVWGCAGTLRVDVRSKVTDGESRRLGHRNAASGVAVDG